jgi:hypothetical protein
MTPGNKANEEILSSVENNPHRLRFAASIRKTITTRHGRFYLDGIQRASNDLLPAIRDVLPASSAKVHEIHAKLQLLLQARPYIDADEALEETRQNNDPRNGHGKRLRNLFRKHRR